MLPGRELINEIEKALSDLDVMRWELSGNLADYILDRGDFLLEQWREIKRDYSKESKREQLSMMFDLIPTTVLCAHPDISDCFHFFPIGCFSESSPKFFLTISALGDLISSKMESA